MALQFSMNWTSCLGPHSSFTRSHNNNNPPPLSLPIIKSPTFTRSPIIHSPPLKRYTLPNATTATATATVVSEPRGPLQLGLDLNKKGDNLMILFVQRKFRGQPTKCNVLSTENNSFRPVQSGKYLPNLSRLTDQNFEVVASCNTWILLYSSRGHDEEEEEEEEDGTNYFLWDPATDHLKPLLEPELKPRLLPDVADVGTLLWGIWFDRASGDYKLVFCAMFEYDELHDYPHYGQAEIQAYVMSLKTGLWEEIVFPHQPNIEPFPNCCVHINGFYYWAAHWHKLHRWAIIPFDCVKGEFPAALIPLPPTDKELSFFDINIVLADFHGSLAAIVHDNCFDNWKGFAVEMDTPFGFEIWVWHEGSWTLNATSHVPTSAAITKVMGLFKNDKLLLVNSKNELLLYDSVTNDLENLGLSGGSHILSRKILSYYARSDII